VDRHSVRSETIRSLGYDESSETLEIEFASGAVYQYFDVPISVIAELDRVETYGESIGSYVQRQIRPSFRYARV
jgi:hypothetical protein